MVKVKFCGFTCEEDLNLACELKPDYVGFIVGIPSSLRNLEVERARELMSQVPSGIGRVCVTRMGFPRLLEAVRVLQPDYIQIPPILSPEQLRRLREKAGIIMVFSVPPGRVSAAPISAVIETHASLCDMVLLDTHGPTGGGTGLVHDWGISREIRRNVKLPFFLAGGLNPENVAKAIQMVEPDGVDVSTGIESMPGRKDPEKMRRFLEAAKNA